MKKYSSFISIKPHTALRKMLNMIGLIVFMRIDLKILEDLQINTFIHQKTVRIKLMNQMNVLLDLNVNTLTLHMKDYIIL